MNSISLNSLSYSAQNAVHAIWTLVGKHVTAYLGLSSNISEPR